MYIKKFFVRLLCCVIPVAKWRRGLRAHLCGKCQVTGLKSNKNTIDAVKEFHDYLSQTTNCFFLLERGLQLDANKKHLRDQVNAKMDSKEYKTINNPCLCGANDDEIIAVRDRYGIKINTVICKHCGLIRTCPYYDEESLNKFYNIEYRRLYTLCNNDFDAFFAQQIQKGEGILDELHNCVKFSPKNKVVYEIGTGMGGILKPFMVSGANIKGVDLGKEYIDIGIQKGLDLEIGSLETLKKYTKADLLILSRVVEHIIDPITFLTQCRDIVNDKGFIYVAVPTIEMIGTFYENNLFAYLQNAHVYDFSIQTICYVLECAGWSPVHINNEQGAVIAKKVNKFRKRTDVDSKHYKYALTSLKQYDELFFSKDVNNG